MSDDAPAPVVTMVGVPAGTGSAFIPNHKFPGTMRLQTAVGSTLMFAIVNHPRVNDPEFQERYQRHLHDFQNAELVVDGETYRAVEVQDSDLGLCVRAADVNGYAVIVSVPLGTDVPEVTVEWPESPVEP